MIQGDSVRVSAHGQCALLASAQCGHGKRFWELEGRFCDFSSGSRQGRSGLKRGEAVVEWDEELAEFCEKKNTPVCYGKMIMFEGRDRLEKSEGMELTWCEEYDIMLEYLCWVYPDIPYTWGKGRGPPGRFLTAWAWTAWAWLCSRLRIYSRTQQ